MDYMGNVVEGSWNRRGRGRCEGVSGMFISGNPPHLWVYFIKSPICHLSKMLQLETTETELGS